MSEEKENMSAAFRVTFGTSVWVAILTHVIAVEIYVCDSLEKKLTQACSKANGSNSCALRLLRVRDCGW